MNFLNKILHKNKQTEVEDSVQENVKEKQIGLQVKFPGCDKFVPLGKAQYNM